MVELLVVVVSHRNINCLGFAVQFLLPELKVAQQIIGSLPTNVMNTPSRMSSRGNNNSPRISHITQHHAVMHLIISNAALLPEDPTAALMMLVLLNYRWFIFLVTNGARCWCCLMLA